MSNFKYDKQSLQNAEDVYAKLERLDPQHRIILESMATIIAPKIDMKEASVRGFLLKSMKLWQQKNKMKIGDLLHANLENRKRHMRQGMNMLAIVLNDGVLKGRIHEQKLLQQAIDEAYKVYEKKYLIR